jgi:hypothetical protein
MAEGDDDTTYSIVDPTARSSSKRPTAPTMRARSEAPPGASTPPIEQTLASPQEMANVLGTALRDPPPEDSEKPRDNTSLPPSSALDSAEESRHALSVHDIDRLLETHDYRKVCELLGPPERAQAMSPKLTLLYIAARGELGHGPELADLPHLAMEASGRILEMPASSHASRIVAKRLLGLSTPAVKSRMPPTRIGFIAAALVIGLVVGWFIGPGGMKLFQALENIGR